MKLKLSFLLLLIATTLVAQQSQIEIQKAFGGIKLMQNGQVLRPKMVLDIMKTNPEAVAEFKKAKSNFDAGQGLGFVGGALIGWPLGNRPLNYRGGYYRVLLLMPACCRWR